MAATLAANDWLVFLDGVQVPHQAITVSFGVGTVSRGSVVLDPDVILTRIRPRAVVALFCRDRFSGTNFQSDLDEVQNSYFYYGGGEVTGYEDIKDPQARQFVLTFESDLGLLDAHQAFSFGLGGNFTFGQVVGTNVVNPLDLAGPTTGPLDVLKIAAIGPVLAKDSTGKADSSAIRPSGSGDDEEFALRIQRVLAWLASGSASLRLQLARSRLLNKIAGIQDRMLDEVFNASIAKSFFGEVSSKVTSSMSVLGVLREFSNVVGHSFTTVPLPAPDLGPEGEFEIVPVPSSFEKHVRPETLIRRSWYRNDYVFLPNLFYSAPPPCNLIFPDLIGRRAVSRLFSSEPTRTVFEDPFFPGFRLPFVHVDGLKAVPDGVTPDVFWANFLKQTSAGSFGFNVNHDSAYVSSVLVEKAEPKNLLNYLSDDEIEKGIVLKMQVPDAEYALARARVLDLSDKTGREAMRAHVKDADGKSKESVYFRYVRDWLRYKHQLSRFNRPTTLNLQGHRWLVPGFSAVIFDEVTTYQAYVNTVTLTVDASGVETTQADLTHVRPVTQYNQKLLSDARATRNSLENRTESAVNIVKDAYDADTALQEQLLDDFRDIVVRKDTEVRAEEYQSIYQAIEDEANLRAIRLIGPEADVAGALTARRFNHVADLHRPFLNKVALTSLSPYEALGRVADAVAALREFNNAQVDNVINALPAFGNSQRVIEAINESKLLIDRNVASVRELISRIDSELDFPIPPEFYNEDFINIESLDKMYQKVLGCQPLYTGPYAKGITGGSADRSAAYEQHVKMLEVLGRIYGPAAAQSGIPNSDRQFKDWEEARSGSSEGAFEWQHRNFLKRRAMSLSHYLVTHGFKPVLAELVSDEPDPTVFYWMVPEAVDDAKVEGRSWDNSVISGIVDDKQAAPRIEATVNREYLEGILNERSVNLADQGFYAILDPVRESSVSVGFTTATLEDLGIDSIDTRVHVVVLVEDGKLEAIPVPEDYAAVAPSSYQDPLIKERRSSASVRLTGEFRQELIIQYSRRHFGSRGLAGS